MAMNSSVIIGVLILILLLIIMKPKCLKTVSNYVGMRLPIASRRGGEDVYSTFDE
jgi:hypothetical protein